MSTTDADREMFVATLRRINRETEKFIAEHDKLAAEARKCERERTTIAMSAGAAIALATAALLGVMLNLAGVLNLAGMLAHGAAH